MADIEGPEQLPLNPEENKPGHISLRPDAMSVTVPTADERHLVTSDQLEAICRGGKDRSFDWCLFLFGIAAGLFQNLLAVISSYWNKDSPAGKDVLLAIICASCIASGVAKFTEHRKTKTDVDELKTRMMSGRKVLVK